jgi:CRP-like cAMP-binding protein
VSDPATPDAEATTASGIGGRPAASYLVSTHLFGDCGEDALNDLASSCRTVTLKPGDVLLRQGEVGDCMYVVAAGRLEVTQLGPDGSVLCLGEVRSGENIGEGALLDGAPRMASVTATSDATVIELSRASLNTFLERHASVRASLRESLEYRLRWARTRRFRPDRDALIRMLSEALGVVDVTALTFLADEVGWETLPRGAILMRQGEPGDCLYFVVSGQLRVFGIRDDGERINIATSGPGETLGEMALLSNEPRAASIEALSDAELLRLSKTGFDRLINDHPRTMAVFTRIIAARLTNRIRSRSTITQLRTMPLVTLADCEDVVRTQHLVLRNLKITQMYHRLSVELTMLLGHADANWCTFACNASKTAGYSIRREEIPMAELFALMRRSGPFRRPLSAIRRRALKTSIAARCDRILQAVTDAISVGNLKVFAELGPVFSRLIHTFRADVEYDGDKLARFLSTLKAGPTETGGQDTLAEALTHYYEAAFEQSPKKRTELILLGNIKVGLHEQMRLQPNIVEALNAPLAVGLQGASFSWLRRVWPGFAVTALERWFAARERGLVEWFTKLWRRVVTRSLMTIRLPYGDLRLGADVPELPNARSFADMLQTSRTLSSCGSSASTISRPRSGVRAPRTGVRSTIGCASS